MSLGIYAKARYNNVFTFEEVNVRDVVDDIV